MSKNQNGGMTKTCETQLVKVSSMSPSQKEAFKQNLKSAEEVACTLVYEDRWSLLRPKKQQVCYIVVTTIKISACVKKKNVEQNVRGIATLRIIQNLHWYQKFS